MALLINTLGQLARPSAGRSSPRDGIVRSPSEYPKAR
jgi:hypothetical protein